MEKSNLSKKKSTFWTVVGILLAVAALCVVAAKVYQKFFKKKRTEVIEATEGETELLEAAEDADESADTEAEVLEVPAEAVIANTEDME